MDFKTFLNEQKINNLNEGLYLDDYGIFESPDYSFYKASKVTIKDRLPNREIFKHINTDKLEVEHDCVYTYDEPKEYDKDSYDVYILIHNDDAHLLKSIKAYDFKKSKPFFHSGSKTKYANWRNLGTPTKE